MIAVTFAARRLPTLTPEEFDNYWANEHAPLLIRHASVLGFLSYVQVPTSYGGLSRAMARQRGCSEPFDGVAELRFESLEAMLEAGKSSEAQRVNAEILADEARFIDLANSHVMVGDERRIVR